MVVAVRAHHLCESARCVSPASATGPFLQQERQHSRRATWQASQVLAKPRTRVLVEAISHMSHI